MRRSQALHVTTEQLGGEAEVERPHSPRIRQDCISGTELTGSLEERLAGRMQCGYYHCKRFNLNVLESESMPGKRYDGIAPPGTIRTHHTSASSPSCALDVVHMHPNGLSAAEIAQIMGESKRRIEQITAEWKCSAGAVRVLEANSSDSA